MLVCNRTGRIIPECPGMSPGCLRICRTWDLCVMGQVGLSRNVLGCPQDVSGYVGLGTCV